LIDCVAIADEEQLKQFVSKPKDFINGRKHFVLGLSDQIPLWIKSGSEKEIFAEFEVNATKQSEIREKLKHYAETGSLPQKADSAVIVELPSAQSHGQKQLRSRREQQSGRYRITYEVLRIFRIYLKKHVDQQLYIGADFDSFVLLHAMLLLG
jgi:hypothetical protein